MSLKATRLHAAILGSLALAIAGTTFAADDAQPSSSPRPHETRGPGADGGPRQGPDHARFGERRLAALKEKLQLSSAQEGAWQTWQQAMRPPARPAPAEGDAKPQDGGPQSLAKLTTPERIDLRNAHKARMDQLQAERDTATKTFYASLTAEQQKIFDAETLPRPPQGPRGPQEHRKGDGHRPDAPRPPAPPADQLPAAPASGT
ncbi:hypothetical protein D8I35_07670 [Corticibacter populi]|uniref:LTXXQ motif family protein n=1 Tax=Corticibacter populi TaxID=1550736 RepID=A0A3M6QTS3_9BURK|nr:Spy/CpxP family protein refolding chaperone [Corticibacter populi]RMX06407.1 hypothetical protein D8I35_07670 [Corticibacter populi]RZS32046.1 LTXXQ motif family protein [Corticibacter populi]